MPFTTSEIALRVGGKVVGDGSLQLKAMAPADTAKAGDLTFAENDGYFARANKSGASAILVDEMVDSSVTSKTLVRVANARVAFAKVLTLFFPAPTFAPGLHSTALIAKTAQVDSSAHIGPFCAVGDRVRIGPRSVLQGGNHVAADCVLGEDTILFPNVTVYPRCQIGNRVVIHAGSVIGSDGFGYVFDSGFHCKVPQIGNVIINDDVEIGANVTIDRGALGSTVIGKGTKIDNLVQIAHNVVIGEHCIVVAQVGIAGSSKLGNYVTLAGQAGIAGHLQIGDRVTVAAQSGVMNDIPAGEKWFGYPALPGQQMKRIHIASQRLPELLQRVAELERQLQALQKNG